MPDGHQAGAGFERLIRMDVFNRADWVEFA